MAKSFRVLFHVVGGPDDHRGGVGVSRVVDAILRGDLHQPSAGEQLPEAGQLPLHHARDAPHRVPQLVRQPLHLQLHVGEIPQEFQ